MQRALTAAVNAAGPRDTITVLPGTYAQDVVITKDDIKLIGLRATIEPPARSTSPCGPSGICVLGAEGVTVSGFTVRGFTDTGIIGLGAEDGTFAGNRTVDNDEYGLAAFESTGMTFAFNHASGSNHAGIYLGDAPEANVKIFGNTATDSGYGIFLRNALTGTVSGNTLHGNCIGVLVLGGAPGPAGKFTIAANSIRNNTRACPPGNGPPSSGLGVALLSSTGNRVVGNVITGNVATGPTLGTGGVFVANLLGIAPTDNLVSGNLILHNSTDIVWDGSGTGNRFAGNRCDTSNPASLC